MDRIIKSFLWRKIAPASIKLAAVWWIRHDCIQRHFQPCCHIWGLGLHCCCCCKVVTVNFLCSFCSVTELYVSVCCTDDICFWCLTSAVLCTKHFETLWKTKKIGTKQRFLCKNSNQYLIKLRYSEFQNEVLLFALFFDRWLFDAVSGNNGFVAVSWKSWLVLVHTYKEALGGE